MPALTADKGPAAAAAVALVAAADKAVALVVVMAVVVVVAVAVVLALALAVAVALSSCICSPELQRGTWEMGCILALFFGGGSTREGPAASSRRTSRSTAWRGVAWRGYDGRVRIPGAERLEKEGGESTVQALSFRWGGGREGAMRAMRGM